VIFRKNNKKIVWIVLGVLVCANILVWVVVYELGRPQLLEVVFEYVVELDVCEPTSLLFMARHKNQVTARRSARQSRLATAAG